MTALTHDPAAQTLTLQFQSVPEPTRMTYGTLQFTDIQDYAWHPFPLPDAAPLPAPPSAGPVMHISETPAPDGIRYQIVFIQGLIIFRGPPPAWSEWSMTPGVPY